MLEIQDSCIPPQHTPMYAAIPIIKAFYQCGSFVTIVKIILEHSLY